MFCEECGTKNAKNTAFCENCGHKLQEVETVKTVREKKPMDKKTKVIIGVVSILAVVLIGVYVYVGSLLKPDVIDVDYYPVINTSERINATINDMFSIKKRKDKTLKCLNDIENKNIKDKEKVLNLLKDKLKLLEIRYNECNEKLTELELYNFEVLKDYDENFMYFYNKAIIEGIRNSIAHGNVLVDKYDIDGDINNVTITFNDIYNGKLTFSLTTKLYIFESIFSNNNLDYISSFVKEKIKKLD